ncbi:MAG: hypothetical protein ACOYLX_01185 [Burkholderiaceae bacterium]
MDAAPAPRTLLLRRQGLIDSGFALATAVLLLGGSASPAITVSVGLVAVWMAWRGRTRYEQAEPLKPDEARELDRLGRSSRTVREWLAVIERAGQSPVRWDLERCRRLARVESALDGSS